MNVQVTDDPRAIGVEVLSPLVQSQQLDLPANATDCAFSSCGTICAVSLGDGSISLFEISDSENSAAPKVTTVNDKLHHVAAVGIQSLGSDFVSIGQDGRAVWIDSSAPENSRILFEFPGAWIESIAVSEDSGLIALASGHRCVVVDRQGNVHLDADVGSTISDLAFDAVGRRLAISRYDGVTTATPATGELDLQLDWKGSHTGVSWSPSGRYIVTATQEKELHVWDLVTLQDFRIGGYPRKCHQMVWSAKDEILACSGADVITAWSFAGTGPAGRPPVEIGFVFGGTVSAVAAHPEKPLIAGGFSTGNVLVGATGKGEAVVAKAAGGSPVTCLAWSPTGTHLVAGNEAGGATLFTLADDLKVK